MITLPEIADIIETEGINLRIFEDRCARSLPNKRMIYLPISFLRQNNNTEVVISLLHEIEHIRKTTYDLDRFDLSEEEFMVYNCIEDIRIDASVMKQYDMYNIYRATFRETYGKRYVKGTIVERMSWLTLLDVLGLRKATVTTRKREEKTLKELELPLHFTLISTLLNRLEKSKRKADYEAVECAIKEITEQIKKEE